MCHNDGSSKKRKKVSFEEWERSKGLREFTDKEKVKKAIMGEYDVRES